MDRRTTNLVSGMFAYGGLSSGQIDSIIRLGGQSFICSKNISRSTARHFSTRLEQAGVDFAIVPAFLLDDAEVGEVKPLDCVENSPVILDERHPVNETFIGNILVIFLFAVPAFIFYPGPSRTLFGPIFGLACGVLFTSATVIVAIREGSSRLRLRQFAVALVNLIADVTLILMLLRRWRDGV